MTLQVCKGRPYKAYVKKLDNGFGIKTVNAVTGVENILIITANSIKGSHSDKKKVNSPSQILIPLFNKFSEETLNISQSLPSLKKPIYEINKVLAYVEPYLRELKPDIAGFHIFEAGSTKSSKNVQKTSVIFVTNTDLARKKGVHFNIPGELMNVFTVDGKNEEGKIKFKADSVVKPLTIVVSDYVLHINICYDSPSKPKTKTVGTQTRKRYVLSSSVDDNKPIYKIDSYLPSNLQVKCEQKFTQTDSSVLMEEPLLPPLSLHKHYQDKSVQTVFFKELTSYTPNASSDRIFNYFRDKSGVKSDEGIFKTYSLKYTSKETIDHESSSSSFKSYDSHAHMNHTAVLNHLKDKKMYKSAKSKESKQNIKEPTSTDRKKEKEMLTLFNNNLNYNTKTTASDNAFENIEPTFSSNTTVSSQTPTIKEDRSETLMKREDYKNETTQVRNIKSSSDVSIKDIKVLLNQTTDSLQKLYSVVELLEKKSVNRSSSETGVQKAGYISMEQHTNKTDMSRQSSTVMKSQETLEEYININKSDQSMFLQEKRSRSNQSNTTDCEKSLRDYKDTSSLNILCERCGFFHANFGFEIDCQKFNDKKVELLENKGSPNAINSGSLTGWEYLSKNKKSESAISNIFQDEVQSCGSIDHFSNKIQSSSETNSKDSIMSCKEHNYLKMDESSQCNMSDKHNETQLLDDKDDVDNGAAHEIPEGCSQMIVDHDCKQNLYENKNHNGSDVEKLSEETFINRREFNLDETSTVGHNSADFDGVFEVDNSNSQMLREIKASSDNTISSNGNLSSEESIEMTAEFDGSKQKLTHFHGTSEENNNDPSYSSILSNHNIADMGDSKAIEECNNAPNIKVSSNFFLLSQPNSSIVTISEKSSKTTSSDENKTEANGKVFYFTEVRNRQSWISFKKSLQSCNFNEQFGFKGKNTNSEHTTNQLKIKNMSSGDHLQGNLLGKISSGLQEKLNITGLFSNKEIVLNNKYSSSSTLHIIPSPQELQKQNISESSIQDRELSKKALAKVGNKSLTFERWSHGNSNKREGGNSACISRFSRCMKLENKLEQNNPNLIKTRNCSKPAKIIKPNIFAKNKKLNSKHKKKKWFCFFL